MQHFIRTSYVVGSTYYSGNLPLAARMLSSRVPHVQRFVGKGKGPRVKPSPRPSAVVASLHGPRLEADLQTQELSPGVRRVELRVENTGYLPTNVTRVAADKKLVKPVKAALSLPEGATIVSGEPEANLGHLAGRSALVGGGWKGPAFFQGLPSDYAGRYVWVVRGEGPVEVEVRSEKAGTVRRESRL